MIRTAVRSLSQPPLPLYMRRPRTVRLVSCHIVSCCARVLLGDIRESRGFDSPAERWSPEINRYDPPYARFIALMPRIEALAHHFRFTIRVDDTSMHHAKASRAAYGRVQHTGAADDGLRVRRRTELHAQRVLQLSCEPEPKGDDVLYWE
jgi:hypothetical protein